MSTSAKDLRETLTAHCKHERHRTYAETSYWLSQYKDLARRAVQHSETVAAKLQEQTERAEAAETELRKLREQKPVVYAPSLDVRNIPKYGRMTTLKAEDEYATYIPLYAAPVPAPAVPAAPEHCKDCGMRWTDTTAHANMCVAEMLRQDTKQALAVPMQRNLPGDRCEVCGAAEVDSMSPRTKYACGSSDSDKRPGTFKQGDNCRALLQSAECAMIDVQDKKLLKKAERKAHSQQQPDVALMIRCARRYLALREHGILLRQDAVVFDVTDLDAATDRLLECV
jgi:hypothetical protein